MAILNRAVVAREDELDELAAARALDGRWFEKFCRKYSGLPEKRRDPEEEGILL